MNAAFVPLYTRKMQSQGPNAARLFARRWYGCDAVYHSIDRDRHRSNAMIMTIQAHGFIDQEEKFDLTVNMARIIFPYLAFMVLAALLMVLNSHNRFAAGAAAPVILN